MNRSPFVRGVIYEVRQPRTCPKCGGIMEKGERMVADTNDRAVHYDPPCPDDPAPLPIIPRPVEAPVRTYGRDWVGQPWHYVASVSDHPLGYVAACGARIRPVSEGAYVVDGVVWPGPYRCSRCEKKGPPRWRMYP